MIMWIGLKTLSWLKVDISAFSLELKTDDMEASVAACDGGVNFSSIFNNTVE